MADEADLAAIRAFAAGGTNATVTPKQAERFQRIYETAQSRAELEQAQAEAEGAQVGTEGARQSNQIAAQREADRQADRQARAQEKAQNDARRQAKEAHERNPLTRFSNALAEWAANVPTPGGNLALVLILVFFAFAIIPVNSGRTRLQLIWDVLTGNAELPGSGQASGPTQGGQPGGQAGAIAGAAAGGIGAGIIGTLTGGALLSAPASGSTNASGVTNPATISAAGPGAGPVYDGGGLANSVNPLALLDAPRGEW